jgi:hypothetical protein
MKMEGLVAEPWVVAITDLRVIRGLGTVEIVRAGRKDLASPLEATMRNFARAAGDMGCHVEVKGV